MAAKSAKKQTSQKNHDFGAETHKILHLMIHSLYQHKDIFLREVISNASDACDKLRYEALTDKDLQKDAQDLKIALTADEEAGILTITDNGIGMSKDELMENLGTIARSGTQHFLEASTGDEKKDIQLIGQFGVGFYSCFMVADEVRVTSRRAGEKKAHVWISNGVDGYQIEEAEAEHPTGTSIALQLKEEEKQFLDKHRVTHIIKTYSNHITFPVEFTDSEGNMEVINEASALWTRPKSNVKEEEYKEFYKHVAHAGDEPWMILHNKVEGVLEYTNLLFIPTVKPFDLYNPDRRTRVKLYVKRVFISDEVEVIPRYLRFVQGVVDSEDLPLNISRETLQHNNMVHKIRNGITKRVLTEIKKKAEKDAEGYTAFWENFGPALKEGLCESIDANRDLLLEVCRFKTSKSDGKLISLDDYVKNMAKDQEEIYFITADSEAAAASSPQLEGFKKRGIEVLLLTDPVDDFWVNASNMFKEKPLVSVTRSDIDLDKKEGGKDEKEEKKDSKKEKEGDKILTFIKESLGEKVSDVVASKKLSDSPVCLSVAAGGMDIRMERFLRSQQQLNQTTAKILEINLEHPLIQWLGKHSRSGQAKELAALLFDQACILEGEAIANPAEFATRFNQFLQKALK